MSVLKKRQAPASEKISKKSRSTAPQANTASTRPEQVKRRKLNGGGASPIEAERNAKSLVATRREEAPIGSDPEVSSSRDGEEGDEYDVGDQEVSSSRDGEEGDEYDVGDQEDPTSDQDGDQQVEGDITEENIATASTFKELGIIESLCEACDLLGYKNPTPIQIQAIPPALQGRDIIGLAETGSGKTAAFALPMLQSLMEKPQHLFGLILVPTRELAVQIKQAYEALGSVINVSVALLMGGVDMMPQQVALGKKPHIVVATPGRLIDHLENTKGFTLKNLKALVLDEADRMLDMDFGQTLEKIIRVLPSDRRTSLFSATMSGKVQSLQRASLKNPLKVSVSAPTDTVSTLKQSWILVPQASKDEHLVHIVNDNTGRSTIIFTRTVYETQRIAFLLRALGFSAIPLHGQLNQNARLGALNKFRANGRNVLVATDVAARGLDIKGVDLVLNYDLPQDSETYIHRVGRTARAGRSGKAVSFVTQYDVEYWQRIEQTLKKQLPQDQLDREEVLVLGERVSEAQRVARTQMRDALENRGQKGSLLRGKRQKGPGGKRDNMDRGEG